MELREDLLTIHDSGKLTVPLEIAQSLGIENGDYVAVVVHDGSDRAHFVGKVSGKKSREGSKFVRVPVRLRDSLGIADGDDVDAEFSKAGEAEQPAD
jgi:bifunctional DNA-binding transcriptional regulator/antitoxin component of YhaV-PrlF toxin-antitoxin module